MFGDKFPGAGDMTATNEGEERRAAPFRITAADR